MFARRILVLAALFGGMAPQAHALSQKEHPRPGLEELRRRWEKKSPEERELLRERFEELHALDPEKRREILERARRWKEHERAMEEEAPEDLRRELEVLSAPERERRWREHAIKSFRETGRNLRESLPPRLRRRLEEAPPEERRELLERFRNEYDARSREALRVLGERLDLAPERIRELEARPFEERLRTVLELRRELIERAVRLDGLPEGVDEGSWEHMRRLPHDAFFRKFRRWSPRKGEDRLDEAVQPRNR